MVEGNFTAKTVGWEVGIRRTRPLPWVKEMVGQYLGQGTLFNRHLFFFHFRLLRFDLRIHNDLKNIHIFVPTHNPLSIRVFKIQTPTKGARNVIFYYVQVQLQHVFEVRELEEITEEWLHSKLLKWDLAWCSSVTVSTFLAFFYLFVSINFVSMIFDETLIHLWLSLTNNKCTNNYQVQFK